MALLWKMICNLGDPMCLRHPIRTFPIFDPPIKCMYVNKYPYMYMRVYGNLYFHNLHTTITHTLSRIKLNTSSQSNAKRCNALHQTTAHATHDNTLHTLQHTATHHNTLHNTATQILCDATAIPPPEPCSTHCNTLKHTATHCNTLQHTVPQTQLPSPAHWSRTTLLYKYSPTYVYIYSCIRVPHVLAYSCISIHVYFFIRMYLLYT